MLNPMSNENQALQKEWCDSASPAIQQGARDAVNETVGVLTSAGIEIGPVLEIGPQWGYGLKAWEEFTDYNCGLEIVPDFYDKCCEEDLNCVYGSAEELNKIAELPGPYNFYMRDVVEHFVDRDRAWANILDKLHEWIFISVPIEPGEPRDKAHFGKFSSVKEAQGLFDGMVPVKETIREPIGNEYDFKPGRYTAIWRKLS